MHPQRRADLAATGQHRIETRHRLLEDHRNVVAADGAHLALGKLQQILSLEADGARDPARGLGDEPHQRHGGDRLAAAGFTDNGQRLAFVDVEGDAVDGAVDTLRRAKMGLQILDFEQCHRIRTSFPDLVPGIANRYCGPSFETATEPVMGRAFARPVGDLLRMRSNSLKHNNLMLRSERRERLEAWAASDSPISHNQYLWTGPCFSSFARANGSRECAPDGRHRDEAIQSVLVVAGLLRLRSQ